MTEPFPFTVRPALKNRRVTVMGLGRFGGGVGAVRYLCRHGARVTVTDLRTADDLADSLQQIDECRLEALQLGGHCEDDFREADLIVVNPAVRRSSPWLQMASDAGVPTTSELNLFWQEQRGKLIGVTGSNGKSTTAAMAHAMLQAAGMNSRLGGNLGGSLLETVEEIREDDWTVLELSSFQLHDLNRLPSSPGIAVVTGFAPNHLDWHSSLADYRSAKQTILRWQTPLDTAVLNADDQDVATWSCWGRRLEFGCLPTAGEPADRAAVEREGLWLTGDGPEILCRLNGCEDTFALGSWVRQPGRHNLANAMAAACAAVQAGAGWEDVQCGLEKFGGLPHRLEPVDAAGNVRFINDSLATTPESVQVALAALDGPLVLLAGGYDKQIDLSPLAESIARKAMTGQLQAVGLMGQTAELLQEMITTRLDPSAGLQLRQARTFDEAFHWAVSQAVPGGTVLLSPGCASYDWFRDFAERGARFKELVRSLRGC